MADYTVFNSSSNTILEISLEAWNEYQPTLNIAIRPRASAGQVAKAIAQSYMPIYMAGNLIQNCSEPVSSAQVNVTYNQTSNIIGRVNNDFVINGANGIGQITLSDSQWADTIKYLQLMYEYAPLVKTIGKTIRMQITNILRQVGIDTKDQNGRFKITPWWDKNADGYNGNSNGNNGYSNRQYNNNNQNQYNNNRNNYQYANSTNVNQNNSVDDASYGAVAPGSYSQTGINAGVPPMPVSNPAPVMGMPNGVTMPPIPTNVPPMRGNNVGTTQQTMSNPGVGNNNANPTATIPNMGAPMPPLPTENAQTPVGTTQAAGPGIQGMLSNVF